MCRYFGAFWSLETCDLWDIWSEWWGGMTWPKRPSYLHTYPPTYLSTSIREHRLDRSYPRDMRQRLQFWQLRTWIHDNLWYLSIKSDTGQHSQFLQCFISQWLHPVHCSGCLSGWICKEITRVTELIVLHNRNMDFSSPHFPAKRWHDQFNNCFSNIYISVTDRRTRSNSRDDSASKKPVLRSST